MAGMTPTPWLGQLGDCHAMSHKRLSSPSLSPSTPALGLGMRAFVTAATSVPVLIWPGLVFSGSAVAAWPAGEALPLPLTSLSRYASGARLIWSVALVFSPAVECNPELQLTIRISNPPRYPTHSFLLPDTGSEKKNEGYCWFYDFGKRNSKGYFREVVLI